MTDITLKVGDRELALGDLVSLTVKERVLQAAPELVQALSAAGVRVGPAAEIAAVTDDTGVYLNYVDGRWVASKSNRTHPNVNPGLQHDVLGQVPESLPEEVDIACRAAQRDFDAWRAVSGDIKVKVFYRLAELMKEQIEPMVRVMTREMGKSWYDSRLDVLEAIGVCEALAPQGMSVTGKTYPNIIAGLTMESRLAPRGVAAIVTPFNFPVAIPLAQVVAALVTGNTVVWKPAHLVPESSQALARLITRALDDTAAQWNVRLPSGIFNLVQGDETTGAALIANPHVQTLSFTGSKAVGDKVDATASSLGKRVMKEVAGINCFYVHASADLDRAARNFVYGKTITSGQRCTSIQELLVDEAVADAFMAKVEALMGGIVYGAGDDPRLAEADRDPNRFSLPPVVTREAQQRILEWVERSVSQGARIALQKPVPDDLAAAGFYVPFTIVTDVAEGNILFDHEIFGPVAVMRRVSGLAEAIQIINTKVGIVGCVDARDKDVSETFIDRVLRTRIDDGRHGTGCFWATKFGGDRGAGSGNPALDEEMVFGYLVWKTIYRAYTPQV